MWDLVALPLCTLICSLMLCKQKASWRANTVDKHQHSKRLHNQLAIRDTSVSKLCKAALIAWRSGCKNWLTACLSLSLAPFLDCSNSVYFLFRMSRSFVAVRSLDAEDSRGKQPQYCRRSSLQTKALCLQSYSFQNWLLYSRAQGVKLKENLILMRPILLVHIHLESIMSLGIHLARQFSSEMAITVLIFSLLTSHFLFAKKMLVQQLNSLSCRENVNYNINLLARTSTDACNRYIRLKNQNKTQVCNDINRSMMVSHGSW